MSVFTVSKAYRDVTVILHRTGKREMFTWTFPTELDAERAADHIAGSYRRLAEAVGPAAAAEELAAWVEDMAACRGGRLTDYRLSPPPHFRSRSRYAGLDR